MIKDDWLLRQINEAIEAVARAFEHVATAEIDEAEAEIERAYAALLEHNRPMLDLVDPATLARLVGSPEKIRALAQITEAEAALRTAAGEHDTAARLTARALELSKLGRADE